MPQPLTHSLRLQPTLDETARQDFVAALRGFVLHDMANDMRAVYQRDVEPAATRARGRAPASSSEVHAAIRGHDYFRFYSSIRVNAQEMVWDSVRGQVGRSRADLESRLERARGTARGSLTLDPSLPVPRNVSSLDVHLLPGGYDTDRGGNDLTQGAIYENGSAVFFMGLLGPDQGDIGRTLSRYVAARYPDLKPRRILDLGCTIGQNTVPWTETFPQAEVHAIDVAAPVLRYGFLRAEALGAPVHFHQMNSTKLDFPDESFDIVWSSMFLHEVPLKDIRRSMREAHRVLKKGGLLVTMELPPNKQLPPYDGFYLDWDSWYNCEPFYKTFRDQDPQALCVEAGFPATGFAEHVVPSLNWYGEAVFRQALERAAGVDKDTGRLDQGISWYCFTAQK